tara:strand:- start:4313 stop:4501 length:189 start_codon:yes stop_codon:yes gene_type:complete
MVKRRVPEFKDTRTHKPFTRSSTIAIPESINKAIIRAYDQVHEFGGKELTIEINKEKQNDID